MFSLNHNSDDTIRLSGTIPDQSNGFGALAFFRKEIQNGPDGIALVDANDRLLQFISYQGKGHIIFFQKKN